MKFEIVKRLKWSYNKIFTIGVVVLIIAAIVVLFMTYLHRQWADDLTVIAEVDGEPVTAAELKQSMLAEQINVVDYFQREYGADINIKDFWNSRYGGEIPIEVLRERAFKESVRVKVQQIYAGQMGVVSDIGYAEFREDYVNGKKAVKKAKDNSTEEVVTGKNIFLQFNESTYFNIVFQQMLQSLRGKLLEDNVIDVSDDELMELYEKNKEDYKKRNIQRIQRIFVTIERDISGAANSSLLKEAEKILNDIRTEVLQGRELKDIIDSYNKDENMEFCYEERVLDESVIEDENENYEYEFFRGHSRNLEPGEVSQVIEYNGEIYELFLVKCISIEDAGYDSFSTCKDILRSRCIDEKYDVLVNQLVEKSEKVITNQHAYSRIRFY